VPRRYRDNWWHRSRQNETFIRKSRDRDIWRLDDSNETRRYSILGDTRRDIDSLFHYLLYLYNTNTCKQHKPLNTVYYFKLYCAKLQTAVLNTVKLKIVTNKLADLCQISPIVTWLVLIIVLYFLLWYDNNNNITIWLLILFDTM